MTMWGIHNDALGGELVDKGFISIGWEAMGDLRAIPNDQAAMRAAVERAYPTAKKGAVPVWAGLLRRFAYDMVPGDLVIAPYKPDSTINIGKVTGPYEYDATAHLHPHRHAVQWLRVGVPRAVFPQYVLNEIGAAVTLFRVKTSEGVFEDYLRSSSDDEFITAERSAGEVPESDDETLSAPPTADAIVQHTSDVILRTLLDDLSHEEFEHFVADLLRALGYQARVTAFSVDGGIDVLAHRDPLGLEPPLIKVQCKHTAATQGRPAVQQLIGTLAKDEMGLFVCLGSYSKEAMSLERERKELRLFGGSDIVSLVLAHYAQLPARWRERMPLRQVWVVEGAADRA